MSLLVAALVSAVPAAAQPAGASAAGTLMAPPRPDGAAGAASADRAQSWQERFDDLWKRRDEAGAASELHALLEGPLGADARAFEPNWRLSALLNWEADGEQGGKKADLGRQAWQAGDNAILASPGDVRGHYNAAVGLGLYSEGVGILTAFAQGIEGKFRDRLQAALRIDRDYLDGAPQVLWGRYFFRLPWPRRDVDRSVEVLTVVARAHPDNPRARLYLADSLAAQGRKDEARRSAQDALDLPSAPDAPEDRRVKEMARRWLAGH